MRLSAIKAKNFYTVNKYVLMQILIKMLSQIALLMGVFWALLPGGFGLLNFKKSHRQPLIFIASATWWLLVTSHLFAFCMIWFTQGGVYWWLIIPLVLHVIFFVCFGRDVSASG